MTEGSNVNKYLDHLQICYDNTLAINSIDATIAENKLQIAKLQNLQKFIDQRKQQANAYANRMLNSNLQPKVIPFKNLLAQKTINEFPLNYYGFAGNKYFFWVPFSLVVLFLIAEVPDKPGFIIFALECAICGGIVGGIFWSVANITIIPIIKHRQKAKEMANWLASTNYEIQQKNDEIKRDNNAIKQKNIEERARVDQLNQYNRQVGKNVLNKLSLYDKQKVTLINVINQIQNNVKALEHNKMELKAALVNDKEFPVPNTEKYIYDPYYYQKLYDMFRTGMVRDWSSALNTFEDRYLQRETAQKITNAINYQTQVFNNALKQTQDNLINAFTKLHNKVLEQSEKYYKGVVKNLNIINDSVEYGNKAIQITNNNLNKIGSTVKSIDVNTDQANENLQTMINQNDLLISQGNAINYRLKGIDWNSSQYSVLVAKKY